MNTHPGWPMSRTLAGIALLALAACGKAPEPVVLTPPAPPEAVATAAAPAASQVADIDVSEHVKTALLRSEMLQGLDITVITLKGDVRLTGVVHNQAQADEAMRIARGSEGAHSIHDELTIRN